uniref:Hint domain-containing protein n=1 Tax=Pinguiococcus pyrenoidosus TaxID=172671 RepID=A0A7R9YAS5_9STRA|mmetsp:Transcript_15302/g.58313  ORF Transcript_15302/g.58313 Transcript_15302/m.58313 type:complete len:882 (+) Transcript_15302:411-3056(+)
MKLHKVRQPSLLCFLGTVLVASTLSSSKAEAGGSKAGSNLRRGLKHSEPVRMSSGATHNFTKTVNISFSQPPSRTLDFSIRGSIAAPLRVMDVGGQDTARAGRDRETHTVSCPFSAEVVAEAYANMTERLRGEEEDAANSDSGNRKLNIFSPDDRALLENTNVYPRNAVGLLTFPASAGSSTANAICSGTFVDDDLVLTNAHCLTLIGSQIASNWWQLTRFLVGYDDGAFIDSFSITRVVFNDFDDWAILQTDHSYGPVVSVFQASTLDFGGISVLVDLLGYHGDLVSSFNNGGEEYNCTTRGIFDSNQIRHDCDSTGGSSGSSLMGFLTNGDGPFVVALHHAALTGGSGSGDLTYQDYSNNVANLAIPTGIFWNELQTALEWPAAGSSSSSPTEASTPSPSPSGRPTLLSSSSPSPQPIEASTPAPTLDPTSSSTVPTLHPTLSPTASPTPRTTSSTPTSSASGQPTPTPIASPTPVPTLSPTEEAVSSAPTPNPELAEASSAPTADPTESDFDDPEGEDEGDLPIGSVRSSSITSGVDQWWHLSVSDDSEYVVFASFSHDDGNLDMEVVGGCSSSVLSECDVDDMYTIRSSTSSDDDESIVFTSDEVDEDNVWIVLSVVTDDATLSYDISVQDASLSVGPTASPVFIDDEDPDSDSSGGASDLLACFVESSVVLEKGGGEVQLRDLQIGDEVLTLSPETGKLDYSPVVALPHGSIDAHSAEVVTLRAGPADTELQATPGHLVYAVADCSQGSRLGGQLVPIERVEAGQCVAVVADATEDKASLQVVSHVERRSTSSRVLSVVTLDGQLPLVNGVAASSFAVSNFWPGVYYNIHRLAYLSGLRSALGASAVDWIGTYVGVAAVAAVNFFDMSNTLSLKRG